MQVTLHTLALVVPHVFTAVTRGISRGIAPGSRMRHSSGGEAQVNVEEDEEVVDLVSLGSTSKTMSSSGRRMLQLPLSSSNRRMQPSLRETEVALCESLLAGQRADLEGPVAFPPSNRTSRISGTMRLSSEYQFGGLSASDGRKCKKETKTACARV